MDTLINIGCYIVYYKELSRAYFRYRLCPRVQRCTIRAAAKDEHKARPRV